MGQKGGLFREIDDGLELIKRNLALAKEKDDKKLIAFRKKQFDALKLVADYVFSYNWVKKEKVKLILEDMRLNNYDYSWIMKKYDLKPNDMKCFVYRNMDKIKSKVGEQTIDLILSNEDKVNLGLLSFRLASGQIKLEDMFNSNLLEIVPKAKEHYFSLSDCVNELRFLYTYSKFMMDFSFSQLDKENLEFVLWLLSSPTDHYKVQQKDLIAAMLGKNLTMDEFIDSLQTDKQPFENDAELRDKYNKFAYSVEEKVVEEVQEVESIQEVDEEIVNKVEDFVDFEEDTVIEEENQFDFEEVENVDKQEDFVEFEDIETVDEEEKDYDFGEVPTQSVTVDDIDLSVYADFKFEDDFEEEIVEFKDVENEQEKEFNGVIENIKEENIDFVNEEDEEEFDFVNEEDEEEFDLFGDGEEKHEQEEKSSLSDDDMVVVIEEEDDNVIIIDEEEEEKIIEEKQKKELERLEEEGYLMGMPEEEIEVQEVRKETKPKFDMSGFSQSYGTPKQQFQPNIKNRQNSMNNFGRNTQNKSNR